MSQKFDRREALKLGVAGLVASQLVQLRVVGQGVGFPPRRVIIFHLPDGIHWHY